MRQPLPFTLAQLQYFHEYVNADNMAQAAERLNVSQPALSASIKSLESALGASLLLRTNRRNVELTHAGRKLLHQLPALLESLAAVSDTVRDETRSLRSVLHVAVFSPLMPFIAGRILHQCQREYPELTVQLREGDQEQVKNLLESGECQVALMYEIGLNDRFVQRHLVERQPHILLPGSHRFANAGLTSLSLKQLSGEPFILLDLPHTAEFYSRVFELAGVEPLVKYRVSSHEAARSFVACELGYSLLHQGFGHSSTHVELPVHSIPLDISVPPVRESLVHLAEVRVTRAMQAFESICVDYSRRLDRHPAAVATTPGNPRATRID